MTIVVVTSTLSQSKKVALDDRCSRQAGRTARRGAEGARAARGGGERRAPAERARSLVSQLRTSFKKSLNVSSAQLICTAGCSQSAGTQSSAHTRLHCLGCD